MMRTPTYMITPEQARAAVVGEPMVLMPVVDEFREVLAWLRLCPLPPPMSLDVVSIDGDTVTLEAAPGQQIAVQGVAKDVGCSDT